MMMNVAPNTVIVAEDEALIRMLAAESLTDAGFNVVEATNAAEAITALHKHAGDVAVLFTDVHMPGEMTGVDLALHVQEQWPRVAILVTSGKYSPAAKDLPTAIRFVAKPYELAGIVAHIQTLVTD